MLGKGRKRNTLIGILVALALAAAAFLVFRTPMAEPENPLLSMEQNRSHMLEQQITEYAETGETSSAEGSEEPQETPQPEKTESPEKSTESDPNEREEPSQNDPEHGGTGEDVSNTDIVYFTTNLINGATVATREIDLTITHKFPELSVERLSVSVNGVAEGQFSGRLYLEEGENKVGISVLYSSKDGGQLRVSKTYTIYVETAKLVITTDLKDGVTVQQRSIGFTAYAAFGSEPAGLRVLVNGTLTESGSNRYAARLHEGENEIALTASRDGKQKTELYHITVELPDTLAIETDLFEHEVDDPDFLFRARVTGGTQRAALTVVVNGVTVSGTDHSYRCTLARGNNLIRLKATDVDGISYTESYIISYHNYIVVDAENADETMPRIKTNVRDGATVASTLLTLQVSACTGAVKRLYGDHIQVELNGNWQEDLWEDEQKTGYRLNLNSGANELTITVWDYEDRYTVYRYTLYCSAAADGEKIGKAKISIEATTLGLGYILPPTEVDILAGQNAVWAFCGLLEEKGIGYRHDGSLEKGFYLSDIIKMGITDGYAIPPELEDAIIDDGITLTPSYYTNSLSAFDFTAWSGWMFEINGEYVSRSLSDCYLQDGDWLRFRFTLARGRDIGCNMDGKAYEKEW